MRGFAAVSQPAVQVVERDPAVDALFRAADDARPPGLEPVTVLNRTAAALC